MIRKIVIAVLLVCALGASSSQACTAWGAITPHELLIAKNRDFFPGKQSFSTTSTGKYKFFGLHATQASDNSDPVRMGINEKGVVVLITFASTIPIEMRTI